jgi:hypothetical protein
MKAKIVLKSFPNHRGIPGHQGGSLPDDMVQSSRSSDPKGRMAANENQEGKDSFGTTGKPPESKIAKSIAAYGNVQSIISELAKLNGGRPNTNFMVPANRSNDFTVANFILGRLSNSERNILTASSQEAVDNLLNKFGRNGKIANKLLDDILNNDFDEDIINY